MTNVVYWRHYTATINDDGLAWVEISRGSNSGVILSGGGFATKAEGHESSTSTAPTDATPLVPVVASRTELDTNTGLQGLILAFAGTPGAAIRTHTYAIVEE